MSDQQDPEAQMPTQQASFALIPEAIIPRQAELIAEGTIPFPDNLGEGQAVEIALAVQLVRRKRLIKFIARQIAADIASDGNES